MVVDTSFWPLFEVEDRDWKLTYKPKEKRPVAQWLRRQGRFRHLFRPENEHVLEQFQQEVDLRWGRLLRLCGEA